MGALLALPKEVADAGSGAVEMGLYCPRCNNDMVDLCRARFRRQRNILQHPIHVFVRHDASDEIDHHLADHALSDSRPEKRTNQQ